MEKKPIKANYTPLWPTPFGWANLGEDYRELNKRLVNDMETEMELDSLGNGGTFYNNNLGWQSKNAMEKKYTSFAQLVPTISAVATALMGKSGVRSNEGSNVKNLWANVILGQGGYSFPHTHGYGDTLWSGVYYPKGLEDIENLDELDVGENLSHGIKQGGGNLIIRDSNISKVLVQAESYNASDIYERNFSITPRESLLVLFPAWVEHMVTPTDNDVKRYSISFGIFRKPEIKSTGPETRTVEKMGWVTSDSCDDTIKDDVTIEKE